ncbi:TPA: helix-turn-helix domain-containing protein [Stenotrophomonas maltophilia]
MRSATEFWRDPRMPFVESRRACDSRACHRPHSHDTFSIGAVDAGSSVFTGAAKGPRLLQPGSLVGVPAGRVHACNPLPGQVWSYQMLHLDPRWMAEVRAEYDDLPEPDWQQEPIRISNHRPRYQQYCQLNETLFSDDPVSAKEAALIAFVGDLDEHDGVAVAGPLEDAALQQRLQPVMDVLRQRLEHTPALQELASLAGMSRYQLIRAFRRATGLTPHAWQIDQRIQEARRRLCEGQALAVVAHALGFADQSHFQRVFKAHAGATPGQYRR